ncbi:glycosyltransferase family 9 protein [Caballeronia humi]|uniref:Glycosyltransferase family 9 (Heptosyltransferase) n=1 Tax=Caballeronia humi TaxID=326474 RepID=A0A158H3H1_9BURK|nr:glycosyltransferase family 9 protein [Caballeronia humi]SAL38882.1 Glycosyltransferase family 9 (heptosyltransferase) [Caballeronia humi]
MFTLPKKICWVNPLSEVSALTHAGSLLSPNDEIVAPYDLEMDDALTSGFRPLSMVQGILNAATAALASDYALHCNLHVINGMGVTLGDSIIGLTALFAIKKRHPSLGITLYRPARAPRYVQRLYELAAPPLGKVIELPVALDSLPPGDLKIDIGNHLFWPAFASLPMVDFFLWALGVPPSDVPSADKRNRWLQALPLVAHEREPYVLFCPNATTPVRSIPPSMHAELIERLWREFGLPVAGFGAVDHPHYTDVTPLAPDTADFVAWIRHARYLVTSDTAALHIAAGFDVPTTAFFTTIPPSMRARDYTNCRAVSVPLPGLDGIQASSRATDLAALERAYAMLLAGEFSLTP